MAPRIRILAILLAGHAASCGAPESRSPTVWSLAESQSNRDLARVHELVLHLQDESIEGRERASARLIALGPDALPAIRDEAARASDPEVRERLKSVIEVLEPQDRLVKLVGRPRLISLNVREARLSGVLAQLGSMSGVNVSSENLPHDLRVNLEARGVPLWSAVDDLCRAHGGIRPDWSPDRVTIRPGAFREMPHVEWKVGPISMGRLLVECVSTFTEEPRWGHSRLNACLLVAPGRRPHSFSLTSKEVLDDRGKILAPWDDLWKVSRSFRETFLVPLENTILLPLSEAVGALPDSHATAIRKLRGEVWFRIGEGTEREASVQIAPNGRPSTGTGDPALKIIGWSRKSSKVTFDIWVTRSLSTSFSDRYEPLKAFYLVDRSGRPTPAVQAKAQGSWSDMGAESSRFDLIFDVPLDVSLSALESVRPASSHAFVVAFDLRDVPLK